MSVNYASFVTGQIFEDYLYYSALNLNGLFKLNLVTLETEFLCQFPGESENSSWLHFSSIIIGKKIIFLPNKSENIHVFDLQNGNIYKVRIGLKHFATSRSTRMYVNGNELWIIPIHIRSIEGVIIPIITLNVDTMEIAYYEELTKNIIEIIGRSKIDAWYSVALDNKIWLPIENTDMVIAVSPKNNVVERYDVGIDDLRTVSVVKDRFVFTQRSGSLISIWKPNGNAKIIDVDSKGIMCVISSIVETDNGFLTLPGGCRTLGFVDKNYMYNTIYELSGENNMENDKLGIRCFNYSLWKDKIVIFPNSTNQLTFVSQRDNSVKEYSIGNILNEKELVDSLLKEMIITEKYTMTLSTYLAYLTNNASYT